MNIATKPLTLDVTNYIEFKFWDGKHPHIIGRRVRVSWIAYYMRDNKWGISDLARELSLTENEVAAAILYYAQHKDEIDALEQAEKEEYRHLYEG
jgi:uncharacterized protein (DUF433 family)